MTIERSLIEAVRSLPPEKQQELLEHANRLRAEPAPAKPIKGLWAGMDVSISVEDRDEMRREMVVKNGGGSIGRRDAKRRSDPGARDVSRGNGVFGREGPPVAQRG
jgi:hypothetical protein